MVSAVRARFRRRTHVLGAVTVGSIVALAGIGLTSSFWVAIALLVVWSIGFSVATPVRQAYVNGLIPSSQRATVLSFDSLMGSAGGVVIQPTLGRSADVFSYSTSYVASAAIQTLALPFLALARRENAPSDPITALPPEE